MNSNRSSVQSFHTSTVDNQRSSSPNKRRRLNGPNRDDYFSTTPSARSTPASTPLRDSTDYDDAKRASAARVLAVWNTLEERYSRALDDDDIIDLSKKKVIQDRGVLRAFEGRLVLGDLLEKQDVDEDDQDTDAADEEEQTTDGATSEGFGEEDEEEEEAEDEAAAESIHDGSSGGATDDEDGSEDELGIWGDEETPQDLSTPDPDPDPRDRDAVSFLTSKVRPRLEELAREPLPEEDLEAFLAAESVLQKVSDGETDEEDEDGWSEGVANKSRGEYPGEAEGEDLEEEDDNDSRDELDDWPSLPPSDNEDSLYIPNEESLQDESSDDDDEVIEIEDSPAPEDPDSPPISPVDTHTRTLSDLKLSDRPPLKSRKTPAIKQTPRIPESDSEASDSSPPPSPAKSTLKSNSSPLKPSLSSTGLTPSFNRTLSVSTKIHARTPKLIPEVFIPPFPRGLSRSPQKSTQVPIQSTPSKVSKKRKWRRSDSDDDQLMPEPRIASPNVDVGASEEEDSEPDELDFIPKHHDAPSSPYDRSDTLSPTQTVDDVNAGGSPGHSYDYDESRSFEHTAEPELPPKPQRRKSKPKPTPSRQIASWDEPREHSRQPISDFSRFSAAPHPSVRPSMPPPYLPITSIHDLNQNLPSAFPLPSIPSTEGRSHQEALLSQVFYTLNNFLAYQSQVINSNPVNNPSLPSPNHHTWMQPNLHLPMDQHQFATPSLPSSSSQNRWDQSLVEDDEATAYHYDSHRMESPRRYKSILRNGGSRDTVDSMEGSSRSVAPSSSSTFTSSSGWNQDRSPRKDNGKGKEAVRFGWESWEDSSVSKSSLTGHDVDKRVIGGVGSDSVKKKKNVQRSAAYEGISDAERSWTSNTSTNTKKSKGKERELTYVNDSCTPPNSQSTAKTGGSSFYESGRSTASRSMKAVPLSSSPKRKRSTKPHATSAKTRVDEEDDVFIEPMPRFRDGSIAPSTSSLKSKSTHTKVRKTTNKSTSNRTIPQNSASSMTRASDYGLKNRPSMGWFRDHEAPSGSNRPSSPPLSERSYSSQGSRAIIAKAKAAVSASIRRTASNLDTELGAGSSRNNGVDGFERNLGGGHRRR